MAYNQLPYPYRLKREIDLRKDKRIAFWLNAAGALVFLALGAVGFILHPFTGTFTIDFLQIGVLIGGLFVYIVLHEAIHAVFMRLFCKGKVNFGFHSYAAFAGMKEGYFTKGEYVLIALAPVLLLGGLLLFLNLYLPGAWFWPIFLLQGQNLAGAVGDYYVIFLLATMPKSTLVNDDGMSMRYYSCQDGATLYTEDPVDDFPDLQ